MTEYIVTYRDTAATLQARNPRIPEGQAGLETDTRKVKVGNGAHSWNNLPYSTVQIASPPATVTDILAAIDAAITDTVVDGEAGNAPSQNAVFDAIAAIAITTPSYPAAGDMVIFEEYNNGRKLASGGNVKAQMALMFTPLIAAAAGGTSELGIACIGTNAATAHQITADYNTLAQAGGNGLSGVTLPAATGAGEVVYINCVLLANLAKVYANGTDLIDGAASTFIGNGINIVRAFQSNSAGNWTLIISL